MRKQMLEICQFSQEPRDVNLIHGLALRLHVVAITSGLQLALDI